MPWLLHRYILGELLRNIALAGGVLVTVIAFGAAIKPLAAGMLAPADVAKYVALAMVPMLQFALPFAGGFGATMVLHRLTIDNEVQAAALSGISYRRLLLPVFGLGAIMSAMMLGLVHFVIPHFWVQMQQLATRDATRLLQASVERGEAFAFGDLQIFAERLTMLEPPPGTTVKARMQLEKVAAAQLDKDRRIATDVTAAVAIADIYEFEGNDYLQLAMTNAVWFDAENNRLAGAERVHTKDPIPLPNRFTSETKFMSLPRLYETRANPDAFHKVVEKRTVLASELEQRETWNDLEGQILESAQIAFRSTERPAHYTLRAERLRRGVLDNPGGRPVVVEERILEELRRRIEADTAELVFLASPDFASSFNIVLSGCRITNIVQGQPQAQAFEQREHLLFDLVPEGRPADVNPSALSSSQMLSRAGVLDDDRVNRAARDLREELIELDMEISARISQRNALSVTALLLVSLGALLAMIMRGAQPLSVYLLAFLPSIGAILVISGGEQMMRDGQLGAGLAVMWSGNSLLFIIGTLAYWRLARN